MPFAPKNLPRPPRRYGPRRGSSTERGYGWEHRRQRAELLAQNPLCTRCREAWAVELHHRDRNPFNRAPSNVELLCKGCHDQEHGKS
ncbi:HNH endonuclease OS=Desulfarculus baarsii (strain ATCC 33931 / DSM 2075 / VKM B-1802 / 2st14) GN=Deba_2594 PE=4 SV=1 [Gemmata massiliana]|uniref:HNH endonuclease n=1 Tax=Gemmata massiliana TaxID=1210884 RepID=A0A6P2D722_9BACT|nr:hypothetical protein [Gemmata massiliana]VTR95230.1 HNH endonuclease OS=Desulfarculus baarsii (strain ATCC 33931 / DSM 2075 / VKM B-1802 / 2st14) GN=Deba_2594 PE=4 SV=1 [Gemmata massiliana]